MKNLTCISCAFFFLAALLGGCGNDDDGCGPETEWREDVNRDIVFNELDVINSERRIIYEDLSTPEDICPDKHITISTPGHHRIIA